MSGICLAGGAFTVFLAVQNFTLSWIHSVERIEWQEDWKVAPRSLVLTDSRVKGHGAGMEPAPGATFDGTWWHSRPERTLDRLILARHPEVEDWRLCTDAGCRPIGSLIPGLDRAQAIGVAPCDGLAASR